MTSDVSSPTRDDDGPDEPFAAPDLEPPHRLRDLDRRGRICAALVAVALLLAPLQAFVHVASDWVPANDPALMGIQSLEVGSRQTPLTGQPSTSGHYVEEDRHVDHLGPWHHYMMAVPMRVLGPAMGMLAVSFLIVGTCLLVAAWAAHRRLGARGGLLAAAIIGLITFTTGASSLMNPVSSNIAGYPVFCAAVLLWCVLQGDIRLLPAATAMTVFAAQFHLSVLPALGVMAPAAVLGLLYHWGRDGRWREAAARRLLARWGGLAAVVALILWAPMLLQEATGEPGNLSNLARLTVDGERPQLGLSSAVGQVAHVLGWPPMLGELDLTGWYLLGDPDPETWVTAGLVLAALAALGLAWRRRRPAEASLVVMVGVVIGAGLLNGSSVLDSAESVRLVLYHWIFPLSFFALLALALGAADGIARLGRSFAPRLGAGTRAALARGLRPGLVTVTVLVIAVPALVNPTIDRRSNELANFYAPIERRYVEQTVDQVLEHRSEWEEPLVVMVRGDRNFNSLGESLAIYLMEAGVDVRLPLSARHYVPDRRLVDQDHRTGALLLVQDSSPRWREVEVGEQIADVSTVPGLDIARFDQAIDILGSAETYRYSDSLREHFGVLPGELVDAAERGELARRLDEGDEALTSIVEELGPEQVVALNRLLPLDQLRQDPATYITSADLLELLLEHPLDEPELDPELLRELHEDSLDQLASGDRPLRLRVFLLDEEELAGFGTAAELPRG